MARAWEKVKRNHGSAGIDAVPSTEVAANKEVDLDLRYRKLRQGTSQPKPVKRVEIANSGGGVRKLGIPAVLDRVWQQALVQRMAPIFAPHFENGSCGYRQGRSPHEALGKGWQELNAGHGWGVDADLRAFFDTLSPDKLVDLLAEAIRDGGVLPLIWAMLRAGAIEGEYWQPTLTGVPQGAVATPVWSNIFLTPFARALTAAGVRLTRGAEDFVVVWETRAEAHRALAFARRFLREDLGVELQPQKTRIVHISHGFEFLGSKVKPGKGLRLAAQRRTRRAHPQNLYAVPREKSVTRFKEPIRGLTQRQAPLKLRALIERLNPVIRGWGTF